MKTQKQASGMSLASFLIDGEEESKLESPSKGGERPQGSSMALEDPAGETSTKLGSAPSSQERFESGSKHQPDIEVMFQSVFEGRLQRAEALEENPPPPASLVSELAQEKPVCIMCGQSDAVRKREKYHAKCGEVRYYFSCDRCKKRIPSNVTGRRHTIKTVAVILSRFFSSESTRSIQAGMLEEDE